MPLYGFIFTTTMLITIMGGTYANNPAYESSIFGNN